MYKVLLVDDEYFSREALKSTIPWEIYGCTICGEAKNGLDGLEKARALLPDMVLTDINMPFMDGLDMVARLREEMPEVLCSIITGYSEFEYAKRGIELGVEHFIVKPIDDGELVKTVKQMTELLDGRRKKRQEYESLRFWAEQNSRENRRSFMELLLSGEREIPEERFRYECAQLNLPLAQGGYAVCCVKTDQKALDEETLRKKLSGLLWDYTVHDGGKGLLYLIFHSLTEDRWDRMTVSSLVQQLQSALTQAYARPVMVGAGEFGNSYREIPRSRAAAEHALGERSVSGLIGEMLSYIHTHYADPDLSLKEIAEKLYINYSYLSAQFTREVGMPASKYIQRCRMTRAAEALRQGRDNMAEIALSVGYTDIKYFYRCFKKEFDVTPCQYMEQLNKTPTGKV